jgi:prepilin-type N-terminal cleavage/methylation domain-containing protein/prepilin-type processing-associated H-X9-DG protein
LYDILSAPIVKAAFTLLEILVVLTIIAILAAIAVPATTRMSEYAARMRSVSNMRQIGVAAHLYANDHNSQLPGHPVDLGTGDANAATWPQLLCEYLSPSDPRVFLDPTDPTTSKLPLPTVLSPTVNNTGYLYNGFDDLASGDQPLTMIPLTRLVTPSQVVLIAQKSKGVSDFYVDVLSQPLTTVVADLNEAAYDGGAHYLFADGSIRFIKQSDYSNTFWLVDKSVPLPALPALPGTSAVEGVASTNSVPPLAATATAP